MEGIKIDNVSKRYAGSKGDLFYALRHISLEWGEKENLAIIGESGSGKSTLARLIIGLEKATEGTIFFEGQNTQRWNFNKWRKVRSKIQAVFQDASGTMDVA